MQPQPDPEPSNSSPLPPHTPEGWLIATAIKRVRAFKWVVCAAAIVALAGIVFSDGAALAKTTLGAGVLVLGAVVMILLDRIAKSDQTSRIAGVMAWMLLVVVGCGFGMTVISMGWDEPWKLKTKINELLGSSSSNQPISSDAQFIVRMQPNSNSAEQLAPASSEGFVDFGGDGSPKTDGFKGISIKSQIPDLHFQYRVKTSTGAESGWLAKGATAPLTPGGRINALAIRLEGPQAQNYTVSYTTWTAHTNDTAPDAPETESDGGWAESTSATSAQRWLKRVTVQLDRRAATPAIAAPLAAPAPRESTEVEGKQWTAVKQKVIALGQQGFEPMSLAYKSGRGFVVELQRAGGEWLIATIDSAENPIGDWAAANPGYTLLPVIKPGGKYRYGIGKKQKTLPKAVVVTDKWQDYRNAADSLRMLLTQKVGEREALAEALEDFAKKRDQGRWTGAQANFPSVAAAKAVLAEAESTYYGIPSLLRLATSRRIA